MIALLDGPGPSVDRKLREGDERGGLHRARRPGHSAGHVALWRESDRVLVLGDVLNNMNVIRRRGLYEPKWFFTPDPARNRESIRSVAALEPELVSSGMAPAEAPAPPRRVRRGIACLTSRPMAADRLEQLEARTRYDPREVEDRVFARWLESGIFSPEPEGGASDNFSIAVPPPNVTGALHMGHALNGTIQDLLIRLNRMKGRRTKWIFGTDHAGIATQIQVERQLESEGTTAVEIGREAFTERVWEWREQYGGTIVEQFRRLGASLDYRDERFTMDEAVRARRDARRGAVREGLHLPRHLHGQLGPGDALGDLGPRGRAAHGRGHALQGRLSARGRLGSLTIATVRPETILADTAIAVHPDDERYTRLIGEHAILPLVGRRLPIIADEYVDPEFGTGALKITPGHDPNDFEIGRAHGPRRGQR